MTDGIRELRRQVENIAAISDEMLATRAVQALELLIDAWSDPQLV
jgi:hypothetical protein